MHTHTRWGGGDTRVHLGDYRHVFGLPVKSRILLIQTLSLGSALKPFTPQLLGPTQRFHIADHQGEVGDMNSSFSGEAQRQLRSPTGHADTEETKQTISAARACPIAGNLTLYGVPYFPGGRAATCWPRFVWLMAARRHAMKVMSAPRLLLPPTFHVQRRGSQT